MVALPDLRVVRRPGWLQIVTPSFRQGGFNEVAHSVLNSDEADAAIDGTIDEYRRLGIRFRWTVLPCCGPADLADRLRARGLAETTACAMVRDTSVVPGQSASGVTVEPVDSGNVEAFSVTMAAGWGVDRGPLDVVHRIVLSDPQSPHRLFLARVDGCPAGVAAYVTTGTSAYQLGAVVLPPFRSRGVYQALVRERLRHARAHGLPLATIHAKADTSAPILGRLGFTTVFRYAVFHG
jgi:GNAT superfamily N-acetyltransferase